MASKRSTSLDALCSSTVSKVSHAPSPTFACTWAARYRRTATRSCAPGMAPSMRVQTAVGCPVRFVRTPGLCGCRRGSKMACSCTSMGSEREIELRFGRQIAEQPLADGGSQRLDVGRRGAVLVEVRDDPTHRVMRRQCALARLERQPEVESLRGAQQFDG